MPCRSEYMEPNERERDIKRAAELLKFGLTKARQPIPEWLECAVHVQYPTDDMPVVELCRWLRDLSEELANRVLYDGRDRMSRELANWWDEHTSADAARAAREAEAAHIAKLRATALGKLTPEERQALGVK